MGRVNHSKGKQVLCLLRTPKSTCTLRNTVLSVIIGASPAHIDLDKRPTLRGNYMYLCMYLARVVRLSAQCSREHTYSINNTCTILNRTPIAAHADTGHDTSTTTKKRLEKPGQLLAQGFKLACCVDRVGVQA